MLGILACCNPVPPLVKQNLHTIHEYILKAREQNLEQEVQADFSKKIINQGGQIAAEKLEILQNPLKCPLDMSNWDPEQYEEGLEVLLNKSEMVGKCVVWLYLKSQPQYGWSVLFSLKDVIEAVLA